MGKGYPKKGGGARATERSRAVGAVGGKLEEIAREGAQRLLAEMLELEVDEFLQRARYERGLAPVYTGVRGYRNGHAAARVLGTGLGQVRVRMPRVSHVPSGVASKGFESRIVGRYQRASESTQKLLAPDQIGGWPNSTWKGCPRGTLSRSFGLCWERRSPCRRRASRA